MTTMETNRLFAMTETPKTGEVFEADEKAAAKLIAAFAGTGPINLDDKQAVTLAILLTIDAVARTEVLSASMNCADTDRAGKALAALAGRLRRADRALVLAMTAIHFYCTNTDRTLFADAIDEMNTAMIGVPAAVALVHVARQLKAQPLDPALIQDAFTHRL